MSPIINANLRKTCIENGKAEFELADKIDNSPIRSTIVSYDVESKQQNEI
jgi:hypothetical protein